MIIGELCVYRGMCKEIRGQLCVICFLFPPLHGSQGSDTIFVTSTGTHVEHIPYT